MFSTGLPSTFSSYISAGLFWIPEQSDQRSDCAIGVYFVVGFRDLGDTRNGVAAANGKAAPNKIKRERFMVSMVSFYVAATWSFSANSIDLLLSHQGVHYSRYSISFEHYLCRHLKGVSSRYALYCRYLLSDTHLYSTREGAPVCKRLPKSGQQESVKSPQIHRAIRS